MTLRKLGGVLMAAIGRGGGGGSGIKNILPPSSVGGPFDAFVYPMSAHVPLDHESGSPAPMTADSMQYCPILKSVTRDRIIVVCVNNKRQNL